jgi:hypothetical protein
LEPYGLLYVRIAPRNATSSRELGTLLETRSAPAVDDTQSSDSVPSSHPLSHASDTVADGLHAQDGETFGDFRLRRADVSWERMTIGLPRRKK